jgi:hypothetical protein
MSTPSTLFTQSKELSQSLNSLPLILAGPMVRRVEKDSVCIWLALKESAQIKLQIWEGHKNSSLDSPATLPQFESILIPSFKLGANLHIGVITLTKDTLKANTPAFEWKENSVYSYNLNINGKDFHHLGLLSSPTLIGYQDKQLPSFLSPPRDLGNLRIAHGSCRKPHGRGDDGLATLSKVIKSDFNNVAPTKRPHVFFHTGDQIYADDVAGVLMPYINQIGNMLLGKIERHPYPADLINKPKPDLDEHGLPKNDQDFVWLKNTPYFQPPNRRQVNRVGGLSGDEGSHLISFGEFCATYLLQWSDVLWPSGLMDAKTFYALKFGNIEADANLIKRVRNPQDDLKKKLHDGDAATTQLFKDLLAQKPELYTLLDALFTEAKDSKKKDLSSWKEADLMKSPQVVSEAEITSFNSGSRANIIAFHASLGDARRLLANVSSLMMFDDHDVTDDWYLNKAWKQDALNTLLGKTIIRNGLMAFAVFQAWGNTPSKFAQKGSAYAKLLDATSAYVDGLENYDPAKSKDHEAANIVAKTSLTLIKDREVYKLLGMNTGAKAADLSKPDINWHFTAKIGPATAILLDTRTQREYSTLFAPANLIHKDVLATQIPFDKKPDDVETFLIISPAPVIGLQTIEQIGQRVVPRILDAFRNTSAGQQSLDAEAWGLHPIGFERLLDRCYNLKKVIFLSGDVHYGLATTLDYWKKTDTVPVRFIQVVSSSLKNKKPEGQLAGLLPTSLTQQVLAGGLAGEMEKLELVGWLKKTGIRLRFREDHEDIGASFGNAQPGQYPFRIDRALNEEPVLMPLRDWPQAAYDAKGKLIKARKADEDAFFLDRIVFSNTPDHSSPVPDWRWRLQVVNDNRSDAEKWANLPNELKVDNINSEILPSNFEDLKTPAEINAWDNTLGQLFSRSHLAFRNHIVRRVTWFSHAALLRFIKKDNKVERIEHASFFYPDFPASKSPQYPENLVTNQVISDQRSFGLNGTAIQALMQQSIPIEAPEGPAREMPTYPLEPDPVETA